jgi:hypothetical protein
MKSSPQKPIKILVFSTSFIPSFVIGVLRPLIALERLGEISLRIHPGTIKLCSSNDMKWCEVAIFCRSFDPFDLQNLYYLRQLGKKIIYEIDDNFEEMPLNTPLGLYHRIPHKLHTMRRFFSFSDIVRVYSKNIQFLAEAYGANTHLVKSYFDAHLISSLPKKKPHAVIKIVYPTARIDDPRLELFFYEAIRQISIKYASKIEIHLWRTSRPVHLQGLQNIVLNQPINNYEKFIKAFYTKAYDIGLAPLFDEPHARSKTNNKYRELAGCEIAGIYSDIPPYNDCVSQKKSGILVKNTIDDWITGISLLIENIQLKQQIIEEAKQDILKNYAFKSAIDSYRQCIHEAIKSTSPLIPWAYKKDIKLSSCYIFPSASSLHQSKENESKFQLFLSTLNHFKGHTTGPQTPDSFLSNLNATQQYNVVFYLVRNNDDFLKFKSLFSHCNSIILDLSLFNDDDDILKFQKSYENAHVHQAVSFILNNTQTPLKTLAQTHHIPFASIPYEHNTPEIEMSLKGPQAAYFDMLEQHIHFNKQDMTQLNSVLKEDQQAVSPSLLKNNNNILLDQLKKYFQSTISLSHKKRILLAILKRCNCYKNKALKLWLDKRVLWLHLQWRMGKRVF